MTTPNGKGSGSGSGGANAGTSPNRMTKKTANTIFFRYAPSESSITRKNFETYFSDIGPVKKCSLIRNEKNRNAAANAAEDGAAAAAAASKNRDAKGYGFCKFTCQEDAIEAANTLNNTKMELDYGLKVKVWVELADKGSSDNKSNQKKKRKDAKSAIASSKSASASTMPDGTPSTNDQGLTTEEMYQLQAKKRTSRVILRNLSFYATEFNIRQVMQEKFGEIVEINLPLVPGMDNNNTKNDDDGYNGKKRKQKQQHRGFAFVTFANQKSAQKAVDSCASSDGQVIIKKRPVAIDFSVSKFQHRRMMEEEKEGKKSNNDDNDDDEENNSESSSSDNDDDDDNSSSSGSSSDSDSSDSDSDSDSSDETGSDDSDTDMDDGKAKVKDSNDNSLFLRNLPFDTTRHDLFTLFAKYGRISGIYLVKDHSTGLVKGTAFVKYEKEGGCARALEAANYTNVESNNIDGFQTGKNMMTSLGGGSGGLYLRGRRILVDKTVDKNTAESLKVQRDEDGKPIEKKIGKDKRNLHLKGEGRVLEEGSDSNDVNCWENIPQSDQLKRGRAHQEKHTKLRSPLFFINPFRLSLRNLAKHVDETQLKNMVATGIKNGLENNLVSKEDMVAHWRAGGELTAREIIQKLKISEEKEGGGIIPPYNESDGFKKYIPSVFIDRNFETKDGKTSKTEAPSRGFGFAEFTHHAHALACLRELNNNTAYSAEFVTGGKKAMTMKKHMSKRNRKETNAAVDEDDEDFIGEDGKVRIPRLIVEFTVENKAKARKQAERKAQQLANAQKQKAIVKQSKVESGEKKKKKKGRGAQQRAKKRRMLLEGPKEETPPASDEKVSKKQKVSDKESKEMVVSKKQKGIKPPKKTKIDKEEVAFEDMVQTYKKAFAGGSQNDKETKSAGKSERTEITNKRWFD